MNVALRFPMTTLAICRSTVIERDLLHHSHVITIRGDSYRVRTKRRADLVELRAQLDTGTDTVAIAAAFRAGASQLRGN
jgi:hypothetical protein